MKKILLISILLLLTGCKNEIICNTTNNDDNITITYKINYEKNNITNVTTEKTYKFNNEEDFKNFESLMKYEVTSNNDENTKTTYKKKNKTYTLIQKYNIKELSEDKIKTAGLKKDKQELINTLTENGLICK